LKGAVGAIKISNRDESVIYRYFKYTTHN